MDYCSTPQSAVFSLRELNEAISLKLADFNNKPFQKKPGSRLSTFLEEEKAALMPEERFGLIIDLEWDRRKNNMLTKLIHKAESSSNDACIENIEYHADKKLDKALITKLSACYYVQDKHKIIILGASGAGKTYISCAFGIVACGTSLR